MITRRRVPLDERNVPTSVICSGSAWTPSAMPSRCTGRVRAAVTRSPNAGRIGLKQVNVPAVATASTIGVASLHALSGRRVHSTRQYRAVGVRCQRRHRGRGHSRGVVGPARHFESSTNTGICLSVFFWYSA
jgi:hypothetical protein